MITDNQPVLTALKLLYASDSAEPLCDEITEIYCHELKQARDRSTAAAKILIKSQLEKLPTQTFEINLDDVDLESLATGFMPFGVTLD